MKIGIIGMGFVGGTTAKVFEKVHEVIPYDKYKGPYTDPSRLSDAEVIFICVPTPMKSSGEIDLSAIHDAMNLLKRLFPESKQKPLIVIRSTIIPGTSDDLEKEYQFNFVSNPEFLREKHALEDMENTNRMVIGANRGEDSKKLEEVYKPLFPNIKYVCVDRKTAEMTKYASNVMLVSQVAIANEIYQVCQHLGVDYGEVKDTLLMDERIARNIQVPGPDGDLGFGGKCFPKDLSALIYLSKEKGYDPDLLEEVWKLNGRIRKNKDWLDIKGATSENNFKKE